MRRRPSRRHPRTAVGSAPWLVRELGDESAGDSPALPIRFGGVAGDEHTLVVKVGVNIAPGGSYGPSCAVLRDLTFRNEGQETDRCVCVLDRDPDFGGRRETSISSICSKPPSSVILERVVQAWSQPGL